ncbi:MULTISPECIES: LysR family transcriptional regulator [Pandoraea]|uniref:LysR family transcriptional regulator n=1 Tax=Pandoraea TaxID=93217 RepID=UPI001F5CA7E5|nr:MULTISPECIES: LysR family transcriptional regulator [Pandoraea]MCI3206395.1 LysR family transcriptional regulator [Pandoraea sp. LA3]MDN4584423.1 LysR family transcriptional regulator [Pandoraea capi]
MIDNTDIRAQSDTQLLLRLRSRQLLLIRLLDSERHLGRAAAALSISQPAASKLLKQAEAVLGVTLFERSLKGVRATAAGEVVVRHVRSMLNDFGVMREELGALDSGLTGKLRIGSVPGAVPQLLSPALAEYKRKHSRVQVSVSVDTSNVLLHQLSRGDLDMVLGRITDEHAGGDYDVVPILDEALVLVVRQDHPLSRRSSVTLKDLSGAAWIMQPPGAPQRVRLDAALREAGIAQPLNVTETASTVMITSLLQISDMVAVMPLSLAQHYAGLAALHALSLDVPMHVPAICLITPSGPAMNAMVAHLVPLIQSKP